MSNNIVVASEGLLKKLDRMDKFGSKYNVFPYQEAARTMTEMKELANSIPDIESPENQDQLMQSELKRRLNGEALTLDQRITPRYYDFDTVISMYGIPESDINGLREWLVTNKLKTQESIEKLYQTKDIQNYKLGLHLCRAHLQQNCSFMLKVVE